MRLLIPLAVAPILPLAALLLGAGVTGRDHRAYRVLSPEDKAAISGEVLPASLLAERYQPHLYLQPDTPSPALMWVWYEAVPGPEGISLVYYHAWEGETNPNPVLQNLYALFRLAYYGYPLYDIEYFQIDVSRADGAVVVLRFEMGATDNYFALSEHVVVRLRRQPDGTFHEERYTRGARPLGQVDGVAPLFDGQHVRVGVQTWNHLSKLLGPADSAYRERVTDRPAAALRRRVLALQVCSQKPGRPPHPGEPVDSAPRHPGDLCFRDLTRGRALPSPAHRPVPVRARDALAPRAAR